MNPMGLSAPWDDSIGIFALHTVRSPQKHFEHDKKSVIIIDENGPNWMFVYILSQKLSLDTDFFQKLDIILFENWQGINPMGLSAPWDDYIKNNY